MLLVPVRANNTIINMFIDEIIALKAHSGNYQYLISICLFLASFEGGSDWREGGPGTGESANEEQRQWQSYNQDTLIQ